MKLKSRTQKLGAAAAVAALGLFVWLAANATGPVYQSTGAIVDVQSPVITTTTVTTNPVSVPATREAHTLWAFGTVTGSYTGCTVQAQTSYNGVNFVTLGTAASITVTSSTAPQWDVYQQLGTTSVTVTSPSTSAALGFGQQVQWKFACSGYGTSLPVTVTTVYR